jgi:hypothetical protein
VGDILRFLSWAHSGIVSLSSIDPLGSKVPSVAPTAYQCKDILEVFDIGRAVVSVRTDGARPESF